MRKYLIQNVGTVFLFNQSFMPHWLNLQIADASFRLNFDFISNYTHTSTHIDTYRYIIIFVCVCVYIYIYACK